MNVIRYGRVLLVAPSPFELHRWVLSCDYLAGVGGRGVGGRGLSARPSVRELTAKQKRLVERVFSVVLST